MTMLHYPAQPKEFEHGAPGPRGLHSVIHMPGGGARAGGPGVGLGYGSMDPSKVFETALVNVTRGPVGGGSGSLGPGGSGGSGGGPGGIRKMRKAKKLHLCSFCQKPFTKVSNQKIHERLHTGEKPYQCRNPQCGKWFMWRSSINFHEKKCLPKAGLPLDSTPYRDERRKASIRRPPLLLTAARQPLAAPPPPLPATMGARLPPIQLASRPYPGPPPPPQALPPSEGGAELRPPLTCPTSLYPPTTAAGAAVAAVGGPVVGGPPKFMPALQTRFDFPVEFIEGAITDCT